MRQKRTSALRIDMCVYVYVRLSAVCVYVCVYVYASLRAKLSLARAMLLSNEHLSQLGKVDPNRS